jgi:hypothetical protein
VIRIPALATAAVLAAMLFAVPDTTAARDRTIEVTDLETILETHPLPPGARARAWSRRFMPAKASCRSW